MRSAALRLIFARLLLFATAAALAPAQAAAPAPPAPAPALDPRLPTLFIAGDSTAARGRGDSQQGWGVPFAAYFDPAKVNVANRARGGRSSRTFINEGLWDRLLADVKPGDTVLIQFAHNDGGPINARPARGSLPGLGEETQQITHVISGQPETVHTFGWYLRKMIADVKARGASPIVLSLTVRNRWSDGKIERGSGRYSQWAFEIARAAAVPFLDVTHRMADAFERLGEERVKTFYPQDHTHFNAEGADRHAAIVLAGLKGLRPSPVEKLLSAKGETVAAEKFAWLRLASPINPRLPTVWLVGDSTVRTGRGDGGGGQWGWGDFLGAHLDLARINLVNRAVGGTGVRTFLDAGYWAFLLEQLKPGDVVLVQFGHNDNGGRAPLPGIGDETGEREHPITKQPTEMQTWGWYLRRYIADTRARGATPVICSLIPRKIWRDGRIARTRDSHADWARAVAAREAVAFVDLHELIARRYDELGPEKVHAFFADERTHTSAAGAEFNAAIVAAGLEGLPDNPLGPFVRGEPAARP